VPNKKQVKLELSMNKRWLRRLKFDGTLNGQNMGLYGEINSSLFCFWKLSYSKDNMKDVNTPKYR